MAAEMRALPTFTVDVYKRQVRRPAFTGPEIARNIASFNIYGIAGKVNAIPSKFLKDFGPGFITSHLACTGAEKQEGKGTFFFGFRSGAAPPLTGR